MERIKLIRESLCYIHLCKLESALLGSFWFTLSLIHSQFIIVIQRVTAQVFLLSHVHFITLSHTQIITKMLHFGSKVARLNRTFQSQYNFHL